MFAALAKQKFLILFGVLAFIAVAVVVLVACLYNGQPSTAEQILAKATTIVGKSGWPYVIRSDTNAANNISNLSGEPWDWEGLTASSVRAQFYSVGSADCEQSQYKDAVAQTLDQIDLMHRVFQKYDKYIIPGYSAKDIVTADGWKRVAGFLAVDGGYALDSRMSVLRDYYRSQSSDAAISTDYILLNDTAFGREIVYEMNRLGMLIDLTGVSVDIQLEAISLSKAPVIFSSSGSWNVTPHHLNVEDDVLKALNDGGGIIMVPFNSEQICVDINNCTVFDICEHLEHIRNATSVSAIGLGGDVGMTNAGNLSLTYPEGFSDSRGYVTLINELIRRGWTAEELEGLAGGNFMRVLRRVEQVAMDSQAGNLAPAEVAININDVPQDARGCYTEEVTSSNSLRMARALESFQNQLYSLQETVDPTTTTIPITTSEGTTSGPITSTVPATTTSGGTASDTTASTFTVTTTSQGANTDPATPSTTATSTTPAPKPGSSVALCAGYVLFTLPLLLALL